MKFKLTFFLCLLLTANGFSQSDFAFIDRVSETVPDSLVDFKEIAASLTKDLRTDKDKYRSIYFWISHNIKYDLSKINSKAVYYSSDEIIEEVMNNRMGVCQHYSELFNAMCKSVGLGSYVITGYTKQPDGTLGELSHVWNAAVIDSKYSLIDVTWAAGYVMNNKYVHEFRDEYFLIEPKLFIRTHMPFDPVWQFLDNPVTNQEFTKQDFSKLNTRGEYVYKDSIASYENLNLLSQLENSNRRIIKSGVTNSLIQDQIDENLVQITNTQFNGAVDTLNFGIKNYNIYITHKNNQFRKPKLNDSEVRDLIDNAGEGVHEANRIFNSLITGNDQLNSRIMEARNEMPSLLSDIQREKDFVDKYLKKWRPLRAFMFLTYK